MYILKLWEENLWAIFKLIFYGTIPTKSLLRNSFLTFESCLFIQGAQDNIQGDYLISSSK